MPYLKIREVFRYSRPYSHTPDEIDGFKNHFSITRAHMNNMVLLEKGITAIGSVNAVDGRRIPAIIIRSSPHKMGSETTPWQDIFDVDNGHIRYYGDNKEPGVDPSTSPGNKLLLQAFEIYNNSQNRRYSVPLIFYKAVSRNNRAKGFIEFNGFGIITGVELLTQYDRKLDRTFSNYAFNFHVFSLAKEHELFDWKWINSRRDSSITIDDTIAFAPISWRNWISNGNKVLEKCRRRVSKLMTITRGEQMPLKGSKEEKTLIEIYAHYNSTKSEFEGLAAEVAAKIFIDEGNTYKKGWITPATSDGGADFYGRLDIGAGFGQAKLIVLGQAKCENPFCPTGGNHIARTVARLKRGWLGVYVTTSFFSDAVQREIIEDEYPIMLINGKKLAETVTKILHDEGYSNVSKYLHEIDLAYSKNVQQRRPDELLFE